jgi:hypothetical protein
MLQVLELLRVSKWKMSVPFAHRRNLLVDDQHFGNRQWQTVQRGVYALEVVKVLSEHDFANSGGAELQHVLVCIPCFASFAELVEYGEGDSAFVVPEKLCVSQARGFDRWSAYIFGA